MKSLLRSIDLFPYNYRPPMFGDNCYKTVHSGAMSVFATLMAIVAFFLFGQDFIYKQNPVSFTQKVKIPKDKLVSFPFENETFSILFKFENQDTSNITGESVFLYSTAVYYEFENQGGKKYGISKERRFKTAPCLETTNRKNPNNSDLDLSNWFCVDFDDYKQRYDENPVFSGNWTDSKLISFIEIHFHTCKFDFEINDFDLSTCSKYDKIERLVNETQYFMSFLSPKINFDVQNYEKPLIYFYNYFWYRMKPDTGSDKRIFFDYIELKDDRGWILEDFNLSSGLSFREQTEDVFDIKKEDVDKGNVRYSKVILLMNDASTVHFRSYVKIQQVMANIGGILKIITIIFRFSSNLIGSKLFLTEMVSKFYLFDEKRNELALKPRLNSDESERSISSLKPLKRSTIKEVIGSFSSLKVALNLIFGYKKLFFSSVLSKGKRIEKEIDVMNQIDSYLENKDKVIPLIKKQF